jgi:hypothetical protein
MLFFFPTAGHAEKSMENADDGRTMGSSLAPSQAQPLTPAITGTLFIYIYMLFFFPTVGHAEKTMDICCFSF